MIIPDPKKYVSIQEFGRRFKINPIMLIYWGMRGKWGFPMAQMIDRRWYFKRSELDWWFLRLKSLPKLVKKTWVITGGVGAIPKEGRWLKRVRHVN